MAREPLPARDWLGAHSDLYHPASRDTCGHCQRMVEILGPMPPIEELRKADRDANHILRSPLQRKRDAWKRIRQRERPKVFARDGDVCALCQATERLVIDHIVPIAKGGTNDLENLRVLWWTCNSRKGARG